MEASAESYFGTLTSRRSVEVRTIPGRGRGLFASAAPEGDPAVVFGDGALGRIVQASPANCPGLACGLCGHALGSPSRHLRILARQPAKSIRSSPKGHEGSVLEEPLSEVITGKALFTEKKPLFCSSGCLDEHERILGRLRKNLKATQRFASYAKECGCAFHLLALKLICWALAEAEKKGPGAAAAPLRALCGRPYLEAVDQPEEALEAFREKLKVETETSRKLALEALGGKDTLPGEWDFLEPDGYSHLLGALCNNAISIVYVSPVLQHVLQVDSMAACPARAEAVKLLVPWIQALKAAPPRAPAEGEDEEELAAKDEQQLLSWEIPGSSDVLSFSTALFPPFRGYAIFPLLALINHSCKPNCAVEFTFSGALFVLAQAPDAVKAGEELFISYLDSSLGSEEDHKSMGTKQRRKLLLPYGFACDCPLCQAGQEPAARKAKKRRLQ